jgi:16S rRNA (guanine1516-N2)-methyltransferase
LTNVDPKSFFQFASNQRFAHRLQDAQRQHDLLVRAVGLHKNPQLTILDLTAGFGKDAYLLASLGAQVQLIERNVEVAAYLKQAIEAGKNDPVVQRMNLLAMNSLDYLASLQVSDYPDVIYLDPMFAKRRKSSALVKLPMRWLRERVGEDEDKVQLFQAARSKAKLRIVVKCPLYVLPLAEDVHFSLQGKAHRFDVYLPK